VAVSNLLDDAFEIDMAITRRHKKKYVNKLFNI
jgi:hypothetical protein